MSRNVPMNILLAYGTPFTYLLHGDGSLKSDEIEPFFDGTHECVGRWLHYLNQQIDSVDKSHFHHPVETLKDSLMGLVFEDGEKVFEMREKASHDLLNFEHICSDMARCFTHPPKVKDFYHNLANRARLTFEYLTEGE
jgi:hypothetical protein